MKYFLIHLIFLFSVFNAGATPVAQNVSSTAEATCHNVDIKLSFVANPIDHQVQIEFIFENEETDDDVDHFLIVENLAETRHFHLYTFNTAEQLNLFIPFSKKTPRYILWQVFRI